LFSSKALFADLITDQLLEIKDIDTVSASIGGSSGFGPMQMAQGSGGDIRFRINLKQSREFETNYYAKLIEDIFKEFDFELIDDFEFEEIFEISITTQNSTQGFGGSSGVNIKVSGYDLQTLELIANDIKEILANQEGLIKADNGIARGSDNIKVTVNLDNAMKLNLTNQDVLENINYLYTNLGDLGTQNQLKVNIEGIEYNLNLPNDQIGGGFNFNSFGDYETFLGGVLLFDQNTRLLINQYIENTNQGIYVLNAMLPGYNPLDPIQFVINPYLKIINNEIVFNPMSADPSLISLSLSPLFTFDSESVTSVDRITGFRVIRTDGSSRYLNVTAQLADGYNITLVSQDATRKVNEYLNSNEYLQYGSGYNVTFEGESEEIIQAISDLALAAIVAILLVYMIMAIQFQSLIYPFIILGTIPLAFTGGMFALLVTNSNLSLVAVMGLIILIGVVVNNGIVLIDYINKLRDEGYKIKEAILEAGQTRLRPIFMTALTTILALLTLALGFGEGSELLQPMAITAIGGLIYGTLLTLVVIPTIYALVNSKRMLNEEKIDANN